MAATPPVCEFDWPAPDFKLPATDGQTYSLSDVMGPRGALVMFICNHCPYVLRILTPLVRDANALMDEGVGVAAICSNDALAYPADSFENMSALARDHGFGFPYLHDADQSVARAWGAACTPDFFGLNAGGALQFRGRFQDPRADAGVDTGAPSELAQAMRMIAATGKGPRDQMPSMGCSIKWRAD